MDTSDTTLHTYRDGWLCLDRAAVRVTNARQNNDTVLTKLWSLVWEVERVLCYSWHMDSTERHGSWLNVRVCIWQRVHIECTTEPAIVWGRWQWLELMMMVEKRMLNSWRGSWFYIISIPMNIDLLEDVGLRNILRWDVLYSSVQSHWSLWRAVGPCAYSIQNYGMYGYDFFDYLWCKNRVCWCSMQ